MVNVVVDVVAPPGVAVRGPDRADPAGARGAGEGPRSGAIAWPELVRSLVVLLLAGGLTWWLVPTVTATSWPRIADLVLSLTSLQAVGLTGLWAAGLMLHTFVLTGSLPGLSHRRALTLNLTGSAVSNLFPGGGAAGVTTNLAMMRRWSVPAVSFTAFTIVSNVWDVVAKLTLPAVAVALVLARGQAVPPLLVAGAALAALVLVLAGAVVLAARRLGRRSGPRAATATPPGRDHGVGPIRRRVHDALAVTWAAWPTARRTARGSWPQLTAAMAGYLAAQAGLLWACLAALGSPVPAASVVAAFAVERLTTLVPITPAGTGLAEAAAVMVLVAMGVTAPAAAAGVLLYRVFTVVLEIPVGAVWLAGWTHVSFRPRRTP